MTDRGSHHQQRQPRPRLPQGVADDLRRTTPREKREQAVSLLAKAAEAFADGRYKAAARDAARVKQMAPRDEAARELLGLALYRMRNWKRALQELRHLRRMSGDATQVPVELDCLRALGRNDDVERLWRELADWEPQINVQREAAVVYGSYLLEQGRAREAWDVVNPKRLPRKASEADLRLWYVAARVAHALGDDATARQLYEAVAQRDPSMPGLEDLHEEIETQHN